MQDDSFRVVKALHPRWRGALALSTVDCSLVHRDHGTRGTYRLHSGTLYVAWNEFPGETFIEVHGVFVHDSLVRRRVAPIPQTGARQRLPGDQAAIQVVSLRRTPERRQDFISLNPGFDFDFFDAVDGSTVDQAHFFDSGLAERGLRYSAGAIGCALSHLALWERAATEQVVLTIVEDDAVLRGDFEAKTQDVIARLPSDWDLIMWGWNFDSVLSINAMPGISPVVISCDQESLRRSIDTFRLTRLEPHIFPLDKCFGTCAYSISPAGSKKFKANCFPLRNAGVWFPLLNRVRPNDGIDIAMNRIYPVTNSFVSFPPMAITPNVNTESLTLRRQ
ncbi:MAG TPA: glycosyltransferase family 25 protein [Acetobacteraceae bacterium]|nr:glycosyltransferase family 25 protein [Acetobacteraceae bacterium]